MNFVDVAEAAKPNDFKFALLPFYKNAKPYADAGGRPYWGMTLLAAGSMRFRWNETNPNRDHFFAGLCARYGNKSVVPLELIHSQKVFEARAAGDTQGLQGDGIITQNAALVPVVTAADCVPIYFYDSKTGALGAAHSGWKGTGIAARVVQEMARVYGSKPQDVLVAIGPHIHDCCYIVDGERAKYFIDNFGGDCVKDCRVERGNDNGSPEHDNESPSVIARLDRAIFGRLCYGQKDSRVKRGNDNGQKYALSLLRANLNCLAAAGVLEENIVAAKNCTACDGRFGSFRRQAAALDVPQEQKSRLFTTQAAFVIIEQRES